MRVAQTDGDSSTVIPAHERLQTTSSHGRAVDVSSMWTGTGEVRSSQVRPRHSDRPCPSQIQEPHSCRIARQTAGWRRDTTIRSRIPPARYPPVRPTHLLMAHRGDGNGFVQPRLLLLGAPASLIQVTRWREMPLRHEAWRKGKTSLEAVAENLVAGNQYSWNVPNGAAARIT